MASSEKFVNYENEVTNPEPSINGNTNFNEVQERCMRKKKKVFCITINEKSIKHYNEIKEYVTSLKSFQYLLCVEHFGQNHKHYHMLLKYNVVMALSPKKMFGSHIEYVKKGFMNCYKYITCQDDKHQYEGVTFKIIDEIDKCGLNLNTKQYEMNDEKKDNKINNCNNDSDDEIMTIPHNLINDLIPWVTHARNLGFKQLNFTNLPNEKDIEFLIDIENKKVCKHHGPTSTVFDEIRPLWYYQWPDEWN